MSHPCPKCNIDGGALTSHVCSAMDGGFGVRDLVRLYSVVEFPNAAEESAMLRDRLAEAEARLRSVENSLSGDWQLIETAPKDGTAILACGQEYGGRTDLWLHPRCVSFRIHHPNTPGKGTWRNSQGHKENFLTHWMKVPEAPK